MWLWSWLHWRWNLKWVVLNISRYARLILLRELSIITASGGGDWNRGAAKFFVRTFEGSRGLHRHLLIYLKYVLWYYGIVMQLRGGGMSLIFEDGLRTFSMHSRGTINIFTIMEHSTPSPTIIVDNLLSMEFYLDRWIAMVLCKYTNDVQVDL